MIVTVPLPVQVALPVMAVPVTFVAPKMVQLPVAPGVQLVHGPPGHTGCVYAAAWSVTRQPPSMAGMAALPE